MVVAFVMTMEMKMMGTMKRCVLSTFKGQDKFVMMTYSRCWSDLWKRVFMWRVWWIVATRVLYWICRTDSQPMVITWHETMVSISTIWWDLRKLSLDVCFVSTAYLMHSCKMSQISQGGEEMMSPQFLGMVGAVIVTRQLIDSKNQYKV